MTVSLLTILLWGALLFTSTSLGLTLMRWMPGLVASKLEKGVFATALGLGVVAFGIFLLGLSGMFSQVWFLIWLVVALACSWRTTLDLLIRLPGEIRVALKSVRHAKPLNKLAAGLVITILAVAVLQALSPPWDYDGLMYHLEGPRRFLAAGRITLEPELYQANSPFLVEMLFSLGVSSHLASLSRLVHLTYALLLALATYCLGARLWGGVIGWLAVALLVHMPLVFGLASLAYIDFAWALYALLALYMLMIWRESHQAAWLVMAGVMGGLALGTKYLAGGNILVLGLLIPWLDRKAGLRGALRNAALFGLPALIIGAPWYLKNWFWTGNPIYPLFFGGPGWPPEHVQRLESYHSSFGVRPRMPDLLRLPFELFRHPLRFATLGTFERLSPIYLLSFVYPWLPGSQSGNLLAATGVLWTLLWLFQGQQIRFLLPVLPLASLFSAYVLTVLVSRLRWEALQHAILRAVPLGMLLVAAMYSVPYLLYRQPVRVVLGLESPENFLSRTGSGYSALEVLLNSGQDWRAFMIWEGRSFYCQGRCLPDVSNYQWTNLVLDKKDVATVSKALRELDVTHLIINPVNAKFMLSHDPAGDHRQALDFLEQQFLPACARRVYKDAWGEVYEFICR